MSGAVNEMEVVIRLETYHDWHQRQACEVKKAGLLRPAGMKLHLRMNRIPMTTVKVQETAVISRRTIVPPRSRSARR